MIDQLRQHSVRGRSQRAVGVWEVRSSEIPCPLDRVASGFDITRNVYAYDMTGHRRKSERPANSGDQSAFGGRLVRLPSPYRRGWPELMSSKAARTGSAACTAPSGVTQNGTERSAAP